MGRKLSQKKLNGIKLWERIVREVGGQHNSGLTIREWLAWKRQILKGY